MSNKERRKRNKGKGKGKKRGGKSRRRTRGQKAQQRSINVRLLDQEPVTRGEMMEFMKNADKIFTEDMLEDERSRNRRSWTKLSDAQRARLCAKMQDLKKRKEEFEIPFDPDGQDPQVTERYFEERLCVDADKHDPEKHTHTRLGKDSACFYWFKGDDSGTPIAPDTTVRLNMLNNNTTYNAFMSVTSRIWEDGVLVPRWRGRTWSQAHEFIKQNYGTGEVSVRVSKWEHRYACFSLDKGGRYFACVSFDGQHKVRGDDGEEEILLPQDVKIFPLVCPCTL